MLEVQQKWYFSTMQGEQTDFNNAFIHDSVSILVHRPLISLLKNVVSGERGFIFLGRRHARYEWGITMTNQGLLQDVKQRIIAAFSHTKLTNESLDSQGRNHNCYCYTTIALRVPCTGFCVIANQTIISPLAMLVT